MPRPKPETRSGYKAEDVELVRAACLSLATYLGTFLDDLVVVGGLVPTLLIPPESVENAHVGTQDLDVGIGLALLDGNRYVELVGQLQRAGFTQDVTDQGKPANHRWRHRDLGVTVDFLIAPGGVPSLSANANIRTIDENLSAVLARALPLAFMDRTKVKLTGKTLLGEEATREIWVCGPGAFIVMKALAFRGRGENKDAYDLAFVLRYFGKNYVLDVAEALRPHLEDLVTKEALEIIREDFAKPTSVGPKRAAAFLDDRADDENERADVVGAVGEFLRLLSS